MTLVRIRERHRHKEKRGDIEIYRGVDGRKR